MIGLKKCLAFLSWIASSIHPQKQNKAPKMNLEEQLSKGILEGTQASPLTKEIQRLADEDLKNQKKKEKRFHDENGHE